MNHVAKWVFKNPRPYDLYRKKEVRMKNRVWAFAIPAVILMAVFLVPSLLTSQSAVMDKSSKEDVAHNFSGSSLINQKLCV